MPRDYKHYAELHTGHNAGKTREEMIENLAKMMNMSALKEKKRPFDVSGIHQNMELARDVYQLDSLNVSDEQLHNALKSERSVREFTTNIYKQMYSVKPENYENYCKEMKTLSENMVNPAKHSQEYKNLYNAIKEAADLGHLKNNMSEEEYADKLRLTSIKVFGAARKYMQGKEKVRTFPEGRECFDNALDAIAVVTKNAPGVSKRTEKLITRIDNARKDKNGKIEELKYISETPHIFANIYGADRAKTYKEDKMGQNAPDKIMPESTRPSVGPGK